MFTAAHSDRYTAYVCRGAYSRVVVVVVVPNGLYNCYYLSSFCYADIFMRLCAALHEIYGLLIFSGKVTSAKEVYYDLLVREVKLHYTGMGILK